MPKRPKMLASLVRDLIAPILRECPSDCGMVSITEVDVNGDFSYATIYISALQKPELALEFLNEKRNDLQRKLSDIHRKRIPMLRFRIDDQLERSEQVEKVLKHLSDQE